MTSTPKLLTRREAIVLVKEQLGLKITVSSFIVGKGKMCPKLPCDRVPPEPQKVWGRSFLYDADDILQWARNLPRPYRVAP